MSGSCFRTLAINFDSDLFLFSREKEEFSVVCLQQDTVKEKENGFVGVYREDGFVGK